VIPWEVTRPQLGLLHEKERKSNADRKPFDVVLMFKMLVLQTLYDLADERLEYQIRDRLSFARFLGEGLEDEVPDATTEREYDLYLKKCCKRKSSWFAGASVRRRPLPS